MDVCVIIPAYNEEKTLSTVIDAVRAHGFEPVIINDGSKDATKQIAQQKKCTLLSHSINRGLGAALCTGFAFAIKRNYTYAVTMDADGQHDPEDIARAITKLQEGFDVVIGTRMSNTKGMPLKRVIAQHIANWITTGGHITTDSQSGFRAFKVGALQRLCLTPTTPPGMEISSQIIEQVYVHKLAFAEIPIKPVYTEYSLSKGQNFFVGLKTWFTLWIARIIK